MTCIPIPCTMHGANACHKATRNAQTHKCIKMHKNKRNVTKNAKHSKARINDGVQKNHGTKTRRTKWGPQHSKGSLKNETHTTKQGGEHNKTRRTPHKLCDGGHSPSPIRPRTPGRSAHPSLLVENPVDNFSNPHHNVTAIMWKTLKPVEKPVDNSDSLWITLWKTHPLVENPVENPAKHDPHHSI